jgi:hypothetical protein
MPGFRPGQRSQIRSSPQSSRAPGLRMRTPIRRGKRRRKRDRTTTYEFRFGARSRQGEPWRIEAPSASFVSMISLADALYSRIFCLLFQTAALNSIIYSLISFIFSRHSLTDESREVAYLQQLLYHIHILFVF